MRLSKFGFALCCAITLTTASAAMAGSTFTVAGYTFDQLSTPDVIAPLIGPAFSPGNPQDISQSVAFAASSIGGGGLINPALDNEATLLFDAELSLGELAFNAGFADQPGGGEGTYATALNLPNGNNGTTIRHGFETAWNGNRKLVNLSGDDFAVYESGSSSSSPEGFMVRLRLEGNILTDWYYQAFDGFQLYLGEAQEGSFVHRFDLSDMGLAPVEKVRAIHIANLIAADTLNGTSGTRIVHLNNNIGTPHGFGSTALDPDPLYVGITEGHMFVPEPSSCLLGMLALAGLAFRRN
jgi:hypothetical protein